MRSLNRVVVSLDVGGTLIEPWPSVGHVYAGVGGEYGLVREPEGLNRGFLDAWRERGDFDYSRHAWCELVTKAFGVDALPEGMFEAVYRRFEDPECWKVHEDVFPALEWLQSLSVTCIAISNWDERLGPLLECLGLRRHLEEVFVSCDVGVTKPSPVIFHHAFEVLDRHPSEVIHVGDSRREDLEGACGAGAVGMLLDRRPGQTLRSVLAPLLDAPDKPL